MTEPNFWKHAEDENDIVLSEQRAVAIYVTAKGVICIRQEANWDDDEDACVFVQPEHCEKVAKALLCRARGAMQQKLDDADAALVEIDSEDQPSANALRQRRFREKRRQAVTHESVTGVTPAMAPDFSELFHEEDFASAG